MSATAPSTPVTRESVLAAITRFAARVENLRLGAPVFREITPLRDRKSAAYENWGDAPGVYLFEQRAEVVYIGRALRGTLLRSRVHGQCVSYGDPAWDAVITDDSTLVGAVPFPHADWYWVAALECYLIGLGRPRFNKRDS
jgi:hypothetical protein